MARTTPKAQRSGSTDEDLAAIVPSGRWYTKPHLLKLNFCILSLIMFSSANGYDGSLMNGLLAMDQWVTYFDHPAGAWLGFINAIYWLGTGITYPVAAWVANKYGRKLGVWFGYLFVLLGAILQAAAHNSAAFLMARFFVGVASAWFGNCVPLLINEIAYPSHRGIANALFMSGYYVGAIVAAWTVFGTRTIENSWSWRIPSALQILLPLIALPGFLMAPQSPRWLISVDSSEEAAGVLTAFHAGGDTESELVNYQLLEITTTLQAEQAQGEASYIDLIKTPGNRWRLFISITLGIFAQWSGNGVVSYYLALVLDTAGITETKDQLLISAGLQIWNLIFAAGAGLSVDRFGRKPLFLISAATMAISYTVVTGLSGSFAETGHKATGIAVIPFLFLFFAGYDIALTPFLTAYPCEIWPYKLRSRGLTVTWISTICAIFFNTFVNPIALESISWRYYIVYILVPAIFGVTAFFYYPETKGYSLEQVAIIFDGDNAGALQPGEAFALATHLEGDGKGTSTKGDIIRNEYA